MTTSLALNSNNISTPASLPTEFATAGWIKESLQARLNACPDFEWLKTINQHPTELASAYGLLRDEFDYEVPTYSFQGKYYPNSTFQKIVEWIVYAQKFLAEKTDSNAYKFAMINYIQLGEHLSNCAEILKAAISEHKDPLLVSFGRQINYLTANMINSMSGHYFSDPNLYETSLIRPKSIPFEKAQKDTSYIARIKTIIQDPLQMAAIVTAYDKIDKVYLYSMSSTTFYLHPYRLKQREDLSKIVSPSEKILSSKPLEKITIQMLYQVMHNYAKFFHQSGKDFDVRSVTDVNKVVGQLSHNIFNFFKTVNRMERLEKLKERFEEILEPEQWQQIEDIFQNQRWTTEVEIQGIIRSKKLRIRQFQKMRIAGMTCGELKTVLYKCREMGNKSWQERKKMDPHSLATTLLFTAIKNEEVIRKASGDFVGLHHRGVHKVAGIEVRDLDICDSCRSLWPTYECLYWAVRESGLRMESIESLDQIINGISNT